MESLVEMTQRIGSVLNLARLAAERGLQGSTGAEARALGDRFELHRDGHNTLTLHR